MRWRPIAESKTEQTPEKPDPGSGPPSNSSTQSSAGPRRDSICVGTALPAAVRERILDRWSSTIFDGFLERDARTIVRDHLYREGHLQATIATTLAGDAASGTKTLTIEINPGPVVASRIEFDGNAHLATSRLLEAANAVGTLTAWISPLSFEQSIERVYRDEGLLAADLDVQEPEIRNGTSTVRIVVREGQPYVIGQVSFTAPVGFPKRSCAKSWESRPGGLSERGTS